MKITSFLFILFVGYIVLCANMGWDNIFISFIKEIPFGDKAGHFLLIGGASFCGILLTSFKKIKILKYSFFLGTVLAFSITTLEEFSQIFLPRRTFDLMDLTANYLGIFSVDFFVRFFKNDL